MITEEQKMTDPEGNWYDNMLDDPKDEWVFESDHWSLPILAIASVAIILVCAFFGWVKI